MRSWLLLGLLLTGCSFNPSTPTTGTHADLQSPDPLLRMRASTNVGRVRDYSAVPYLIENLRHEEQPTRFWAHTGLILIYYGREQLEAYADKKLIPPRPFGYDSVTEKSRDREDAVQRWQHWYDTAGKKLQAEQRAARAEPPRRENTRTRAPLGE